MLGASQDVSYVMFVYYVGFTLSIIGLVIALFLFVYFRLVLSHLLCTVLVYDCIQGSIRGIFKSRL